VTKALAYFFLFDEEKKFYNIDGSWTTEPDEPTGIPDVESIERDVSPSVVVVEASQLVTNGPDDGGGDFDRRHGVDPSVEASKSERPLLVSLQQKSDFRRKLFVAKNVGHSNVDRGSRKDALASVHSDVANTYRPLTDKNVPNTVSNDDVNVYVEITTDALLNNVDNDTDVNSNDALKTSSNEESFQSLTSTVVDVKLNETEKINSKNVVSKRRRKNDNFDSNRQNLHPMIKWRLEWQKKRKNSEKSGAPFSRNAQRFKTKLKKNFLHPN